MLYKITSQVRSPSRGSGRRRCGNLPVLGTIDYPHAAFAQLGGDPVVGYGLTDHAALLSERLRESGNVFDYGNLLIPAILLQAGIFCKGSKIGENTDWKNL